MSCLLITLLCRGESIINSPSSTKNTPTVFIIYKFLATTVLSRHVPTREFAIHTTLSQLNRRGNSENQEHNSNDLPLGEILAIVIAALTLLVATIPLFRCSRFHCWVSSSISPFAKVYPPLLAHPPVLFTYTCLILQPCTESSRHYSSKPYVNSWSYHRGLECYPNFGGSYTSPCPHLQRLFQCQHCGHRFKYLPRQPKWYRRRRWQSAASTGITGAEKTRAGGHLSILIRIVILSSHGTRRSLGFCKYSRSLHYNTPVVFVTTSARCRGFPYYC